MKVKNKIEINPMQKNQTVRKVRIIKDNSGFSYRVNPIESESFISKFSAVTNHIVNDIIPLYGIVLAKTHDIGNDDIKSINVDNDFFEHHESIEDPPSILDELGMNVKHIIESTKSNDGIHMRFTSGDSQLLIIIHGDKRNFLGKNDVLMTTILVQHNLITASGFRFKYSNDDMQISPFTDRLFYISKKDRFITEAIEREHQKPELAIYNICKLTFKGTSTYLGNKDIPGDEIKFSTMEMYMFKKVYMALGSISGPNSQLTSIDECVNSEFENYGKIFRLDNFNLNNAAKAIHSIPDSPTYKSEYPLVDFSTKEMKFIERYTDKKYENGDIINFREYIEHFPYGNGFRLKVEDNRELLVTWTISNNDDAAVLYIMDKTDPSHMICLTSDVYNISKLNYGAGFAKNMPGFHIDIYQDVECMISDLDDIDILPCFLSKKEYVELVCYIMDVIVIINERPQRSRMIKISDTNKKAERKSSNKKLRNNTNKSSSELIISRVLKPINEAKEYVSRMQSENISGERNYVLESWPRKGHWRKLHNSDKYIWIEPTTCSRHEELVKEKEIIVKL